MRKRASLIAATVVGTLLMGGVGQAGPPDPHPGATQPTREQNVDGAGFIKMHEQGIADTNITNENLDVTLQNEELDVNVTNDTLPIAGDVNVTNDSLPIAGDVNVTNASLPVIGQVDVGNFPQTQDVNVVGGSAVLPTVTKLIPIILASQGDEHVGVDASQSFDTVNVTSISIADQDDESVVSFSSPLANGSVFRVNDFNGEFESYTYNFSHPVPLNGVTVTCYNASEECQTRITVAGF